MTALSRRDFLSTAAATAAAASLAPAAFADHHKEAGGKPFRISLAQWSLHRKLKAGELDNLDFAKVAREEFDISGVEYVNQFFKDKAKDESYLSRMKQAAEDHGVTSVLIMVDGEGRIGDPDTKKRLQTVEKHKKWVDAAKFLGCHSVRVNAGSEGSWEQQRDHAADGLRRLGEYADGQGINVLVENHGGLSSNGEWLASTLAYADHPRVGSLPDFGNFRIDRQTGENFDRYLGTELLMPFAKAVSAKTYGFDADGNESTMDYPRLMGIVLDAGYHDWVGIEWEGGDPGEYEGIKLTKQLLERVRESAA